MTDSHNLRETAIERVSAQWIAFGAQITGKRETTVVDPEALVAVTALLGPDDARVYGAAIDWIVEFGTSLNMSRLKTVAAEIGTSAPSLASFGGDVASSGGPRWTFADTNGENQHRNKVAVHDLTAPSRLVWRLRSAFGVNARADILAALLTMPAVPVTIAELARRTRFGKRNVALAVDSMRLAGVITSIRISNEDRVSLDVTSPLRRWLEPDGAPDIDWTSRWAVVIQLLRLVESTRQATDAVKVVESRAVTRSIVKQVGPAALPMPDLSATGNDQGPAFERWLSAIETTLYLVEPSPK